MGTGELTLWNSGVWLIPLVVLATVAGLYALVRYWEQQTQKDLKDLRRELRRLQSERRALAGNVAGHSSADPEPFGSRMAALQEQLEEGDRRMSRLEQQNIAIRERMGRITLSRWEAAAGAPYFWYLIRRDVASLRTDLAATRETLTAAEEYSRVFQDLGWHVAQEARQVRSLQQQVKRSLDGLREHNVCGEAMDRAVFQENQTRETLDNIPAYFYNASQEELRQQATKEPVAQAHQVLAQARPLLEGLRDQVQAWEKQLAQTQDQVGKLRQALAAVEADLDGAPQALDLTVPRSQFEQMTVIQRNLTATLGRLEAESMARVAEDAAKVNTAAQELDGQLKRARQQLAALETVLPKLNEDLRLLSTQFAALATAQVHPINWSQSKDRLTTLSRQAGEIGPPRKPRTPEGVDQALARARELDLQQKELARHCQQVAQQHAELLALLRSPELAQAGEWLQATRQQFKRVAAYDPENWPRSDTVAALPGELDALEEGLHSHVSGNPAEPVEEQRIGVRLDETRQLAQFAQLLRSRAGQILTRLSEIQATEKAAQEEFTTVNNAFNQIVFLVRSNAYLTQIAGEEVGKLHGNLKNLGDDLAQRQRGPVDKKARQVQTVAARLEQAANGWLEQLVKDIQAETQELGDLLHDLDQIAPLDEQPVVEARRLLSSGLNLATGGRGQKLHFRLEELVPAFKTYSDYWQECAAAIRALQEVTGSVSEAYSTAQQYRQYVREQVDEIQRDLRNPRIWPPTSVTLEEERQELSRLDGQWQSLNKQPVRAMALVNQLASLAVKYHALSEKTGLAARRIEQEQAQIEKLESELAEFAALWQNQLNNYRDNPAAAQEIRELLNRTGRELNAVRQQARQGAYKYNQVLQALQTLHRNTRLAQVAIDDNHMIDVNGNVKVYH